eukprot:comp20382_c0_seq1/m.25761 comp20382_c0_seq1/g.25761  ORF comp20382_c0_seq1/g.25761 comp20382_c0_seq1/m.25761 type:complete len:419 (-) comp20382_c0_seq1:753-2009(-)
MASFDGLLCPVLAKIAEVDEKHAAATDRVLQAFKRAEELHPGIAHDFIQLLLQKDHSASDHRPLIVPRQPGSTGSSPTIVRTPSAPSSSPRLIPHNINTDGSTNAALSPPRPVPRPRSPSAPAPPLPRPRGGSVDENTQSPTPHSPGGSTLSRAGNVTPGSSLSPTPSPRPPPERPVKKSSLQDAMNGSPQNESITSPVTRTPPMGVQGGALQQNLAVEAAQQLHNRRQSSPQTLVTPPSSSTMVTLGPISEKPQPAPRRVSVPNVIIPLTKEQSLEMQRRLLDVDTQCSGLQARLAALPRDIANRAQFLESIKDIAATIKQLLEAVSGVTEASPREWLSYDTRALIEEHKKQFISSSRTFSSALKDHFRDPNQRQVIAASEALAGLTKQLHKTISSTMIAPNTTSLKGHPSIDVLAW